MTEIYKELGNPWCCLITYFSQFCMLHLGLLIFSLNPEGESSRTALYINNSSHTWQYINLFFSFAFFKIYFLNKYDSHVSMYGLQSGQGIPVIWDKRRKAGSSYWCIPRLQRLWLSHWSKTWESSICKTSVI